MKAKDLTTALRSSLGFLSVKRVRDQRPPAGAPGTLVHVGERRMEDPVFRIIDYSESELVEKTSTSLEECLCLDHSDTPTWLQVCGLHDTEVVGRILSDYEIHPLVQDDVLNTNHRLKVEPFGDYIFVAMKEIVESEGAFELRHMSMLISKHIVITFQEAPSDLFEPIEKRLRSGQGLLRKRGPDYLAWAILDAVTDHFRSALDLLLDEVEKLEDEIQDGRTEGITDHLHECKRQIGHLFRVVRPLREIATSMRRLDSELMDPANDIFWSDLQDHTVHTNESVETLRDTIISLRELHLSMLSQRMNEVMKVLTCFATIFLPLTFLAGVYGMNFRHMPELDWPWAYPVLWVAFGVIAALMFTYFRKKRWL